MPRRLARIAALAVGEGRGEEQLLRHIKALYLPRGCGVTLKVKAALGKGGKGVLDYTVSFSDGIDYDRRIVLLDTDANWDAEQRARAVQEGIDVVESDPCLEAWLLAIHGVNRGIDSAACKRKFRKQFGCDAHDDHVYSTHFPRAQLDAARQSVATLHRLLSLLDV